MQDSGDGIKLRFPERERAELQPAIETLRRSKTEVQSRLAQIQADELARASAVLKSTGVRIIALEEGATIGVWSDLDGPDVRTALRAFGFDRLPLRYLDGAGVPLRYKLRRVEGESVPMAVLSEMERHPAEPWKVRDRMLHAIGWTLLGQRGGGHRNP